MKTLSHNAANAELRRKDNGRRTHLHGALCWTANASLHSALRRERFMWHRNQILMKPAEIPELMRAKASRHEAADRYSTFQFHPATMGTVWHRAKVEDGSRPGSATPLAHGDPSRTKHAGHLTANTHQHVIQGKNYIPFQNLEDTFRSTKIYFFI